MLILMFSTSCKTLYNVLSYTHGDWVDLYLLGVGEGVTQKRQTLLNLESLEVGISGKRQHLELQATIYL